LTDTRSMITCFRAVLNLFRKTHKNCSLPNMAAILQFGAYRLDTATETLFRASEPIPLGRRAVALLRLLVEQAGTPVSKDALMEAGWPGLVIEESNLTVQIAALRRMFTETDGEPAWIETLPRRGYRYIGPPVTVATGLSGFAEASNRPSLAVLPFSNLSGDSGQEYFSDGISGDIIAELSRFRSLLVVARHSSFAYKGKSSEIKRVGRELGVRYVAEGSVRKLGSRVRVTVQLLDAASGYSLWTARYDRELEDRPGNRCRSSRPAGRRWPGNCQAQADREHNSLRSGPVGQRAMAPVDREGHGTSQRIFPERSFS